MQEGREIRQLAERQSGATVLDLGVLPQNLPFNPVLTQEHGYELAVIHKPTDPRRSEARQRQGRQIRAEAQTDTGATYARQMIEDGQRREDVAELFSVNRTTLYRALR